MSVPQRLRDIAGRSTPNIEHAVKHAFPRVLQRNVFVHSLPPPPVHVCEPERRGVAPCCRLARASDLHGLALRRWPDGILIQPIKTIHGYTIGPEVRLFDSILPHSEPGLVDLHTPIQDPESPSPEAIQCRCFASRQRQKPICVRVCVRSYIVPTFIEIEQDVGS